MITKSIHYFTSCFSGIAVRWIVTAFRFFFSIYMWFLGPHLLAIGDIYPRDRLQMNSQSTSNISYLVRFPQKALPWKLLRETANPVMSQRGHCSLKNRQSVSLAPVLCLVDLFSQGKLQKGLAIWTEPCWAERILNRGDFTPTSHCGM